jgi:hypothetical protein
VTSSTQSSAKLLVSYHCNSTHQGVVLCPARSRLIGAIVGGLLITPPSGISRNSHDLSGLRIDDDSTSATAESIDFGIVGGSTGNLQEVGRSRGIELGDDTSELVQRWSILKQLGSWIELRGPVSFSPKDGLFRGQGSVSWDDGIEAAWKAFDLDVLREGLADLVPGQQR